MKPDECRQCPCRSTDLPPDDEPCDCACHVRVDVSFHCQADAHGRCYGGVSDPHASCACECHEKRKELPA